MKRAFTVIELLVASLLMGILTTILTMLFNQSAIAWRTGTAGAADLDDVRDNMAEIREEADNAFAWNGQVYRISGLWDRNGELFDRACDAPNSRVLTDSNGRWRANLLDGHKSELVKNPSSRQLYSSGNLLSVGRAGSPRSAKTYIVNVMSAGPNRDFGDWDDIWSWPFDD